MALSPLTPVTLEQTERPTELVRLYVRFSSQESQLRKGKVVAWDGPDSGYTMRLLGP
jgi:hypothetical protein